MTKAEIVAKVAEEIKISKAVAGRALAVTTDSLTQTIRAGGKATPAKAKSMKAPAKKATKPKKK